MKKKETDEERKGLTTPTSVTMINSFLIKNADQSFDAYFATMKKRRGFGGTSIVGGHGAGGTYENKNQVLLVTGKRPAARDGHSATINGDRMYIFGGDRHHMPFNDLHCLNLLHLK